MRSAEVTMSGRRLRVDLSFVPEAVAGDWVVVHSGIAVRRLDAEEAREAIALLEAAAG